jgi:taurine dioxygenase
MRDAAPEITPIAVPLGAEVRGIDLSHPLDDTTVEMLRQAHGERGLLLFPDQDITAAQQMAFGARFGELTVHPFSPNQSATPELIVFANDADNPPALTDQWHSDETFREVPPMGTMLRAREVPPLGGDTLFASMVAAFEGLSDHLQHFLSDKLAVHDFTPFRQLFDTDEDGRRLLATHDARYPLVAHPVVRVHPDTGRKALYVNPQFTLHIEGMGAGESRSLLDVLFHQAEIPEYQFRLRWRPNLLAFWDNRWTQHYAVHDYLPHRRLMERVTIKGTAPFGPAQGRDGAGPRARAEGKSGLAGHRPLYGLNGEIETAD